MSRKIIPFIVAIVLSCLVMAVAGVFAFSGAVSAEKFGSRTVWSQPFSSAESMKVIDLTGDGENELFIQSPYEVAVYDGSGKAMWGFPYTSAKSTLGDVNGDGVEDIVVFYIGTGSSVDVISKGQVRTLATSLNIGNPSRVAVIRFPTGPQIVLGDTSGNLLALGLDGSPRWSGSFASSEIRGMDDVRINGQIHVAVATNNGYVAVYDAQGRQVWLENQETLRRMRAFDLNGDGNGEVITGGEYGAFTIYSAVDGSILFSKSLGQAISEIRTVELDGDPSSIEIVAGGKNGGVWAFSFDGTTAKQLWNGSLSDKVTEISGLDIDDDGKQEAVIGDDSGRVAIFTTDGTRHNLPNRSSAITRVDIGKLGDERLLVVADMRDIQVSKLTFSSIPGFRFTPLVVGLIVSAIMLVIAAIIASIPPKPEMKLAIKNTSRESLEAERRMLKEHIADVERLRKSGEMTGDSYLARLKRLRGELAENEAAFKAAGYQVRVETFQCPNCGGTLELGMDKCEYCGQVLLS
jgi:hypothetical protein